MRRLVHWIWQLKGAGFTPKAISDQFSIDRKSANEILNEIRETFKVKMDSKKKGLVILLKNENSIKISFNVFIYFKRSYLIDQIDLGKIIDECFSHPMRRKSRSGNDDSQLSNRISQETTSKKSNDIVKTVCLFLNLVYLFKLSN